MVSLLGLTLLAASFGYAIQAPSLDESGYCNLHGRILSLTQLEWEDRNAAGQAAAQSTNEELWNALEQIGAKYRGLRSSVYAEAGTTEAAFGKYARDNGDAIEEFLASNPQLRRDLDAVKSRIDALIQSFEILMQSRR
jgi:hypothetical protein